MEKESLLIASDHGGLALKNQLVQYLTQTRPTLQVTDLGTHDDQSVDYPKYAHLVANAVSVNPQKRGILVCGTGIGMSIAANRYAGVRAALVCDKFTAEMAKAHNNANVICLGGRTLSQEQAKAIVDAWIDTQFEGGRHERRLSQIEDHLD